MNKTEIVVSKLATSQIRDFNPDVVFYLFDHLDKLDAYIKDSAIRADTIYLTKDVFNLKNASVKQFVGLLEDKFLRIDTVVYITEPDSPELAPIRFLIQEQGWTNWELIEGTLSAEFLQGVIDGSLRKSKMTAKQKTVVRVPREDYIREQLRRKNSSLQDEFVSEVERLSEILDIPEDDTPTVDVGVICEVTYITGIPSSQRSAFALLVAQYISLNRKALIVDSNEITHDLTNMVTRSNMDCVYIEIGDFVRNQLSYVNNIRNMKNCLIVIGNRGPQVYPTEYIFNVLYHLLKDTPIHFIKECNLDMAPVKTNHLVVFNATMPDIIKTTMQIQDYAIRDARYVGIVGAEFEEIEVASEKAMSEILSSIFTVPVPARLVRMNSMKGGKQLNDLHSIISFR